MENKDEILADFQSITAIEDIGEAFACLEESNWDLVTAIKKFMPSEDPVNTSEEQPNKSSYSPLRKNMNISNTNINDFSAGAGSSSAFSEHNNLFENESGHAKFREFRVFIFNIHYNQQVYTIHIPSYSTIEDLKKKILNVTKVPICHQTLHGWPSKKVEDAKNLNTTLDKLDLATENELILIDKFEEHHPDDERRKELNKRYMETFTLIINQQPEGIILKLQFPGTKTILGVKTDVFAITNIPVRHQEWTGWPLGCAQSSKLAETSIELCHNLTLRSNADKNKGNAKNPVVKNLDSDSSDEFEDASDFNADDDFFSDSPVQPRIKHLIADEISDLSIGSIQFVENYEQRYGDLHPVFFQGSLDEAVNEACHKPSNERKLLAIYIHHDQSVLTNVFCDQLLKCESVRQTLIQNFIFYGWDFTYESNKTLFLTCFTTAVSITAALTIRNIPIDRLPAIIIIGKYRNICEIISVIYGNVGVDDLLSRLMETVEVYSERMKIEAIEEKQRADRAKVKYEQDMAYQQTLEADMAKEAAKKQKELELAAERKRLESEKAASEAIKEENRQRAENSLPQEPSDKETTGIIKIKIRASFCTNIERKFYVNNTLQDLLNFVISKGFPIDQYKVIATWPHRDLTDTDFNREATLESLKLCSNEVLILEER